MTRRPSQLLAAARVTAEDAYELLTRHGRESETNKQQQSSRSWAVAFTLGEKPSVKHQGETNMAFLDFFSFRLDYHCCRYCLQPHLVEVERIFDEVAEQSEITFDFSSAGTKCMPIGSV